MAARTETARRGAGVVGAEGGGGGANGAPQTHAPLVTQHTNGAPHRHAPLVVLQKSKKKYSTGALYGWCAISMFEKMKKNILLLVAHRVPGAPLVYSNGAPHVWCAISVNSIYSPFPGSAFRFTG